MSRSAKTATRNRAVGVAFATAGTAFILLRVWGPGAALLAVGGWLMSDEPIFPPFRAATTWGWAGKSFVVVGVLLFLVVFVFNLGRH